MIDDRIEAEIFDLTLFRNVAKSALIGVMIFSAVAVFTGSIWKALAIGFFCIVISVFNTWRRYLEPIALVLFFAGMAYWCFPDLCTGNKLAGLPVQ